MADVVITDDHLREWTTYFEAHPNVDVLQVTLGDATLNVPRPSASYHGKPETDPVAAMKRELLLAGINASIHGDKR